jgi:microcystin-dependent protein
MSYTVRFTDEPNNGSIVVADGQVDDYTTSINFVGKNFPGYGTYIAENFLHMLENFSSATAPANPIIGQLWYDTDVTSAEPQPQLKIYDGTTWSAAGNVQKAATAPLAANSVIGDIWADTANQQLYLWSGSSWILVGPQFSEGSLTGPKVEQIFDVLNASHNIITFYISNNPVLIVSGDDFTPKAVIEGFPLIRKGLNLVNTNSAGVTDSATGFKLYGTASDSEKLGGEPATSYLRSNVASVTNSPLSIRNNQGLTLGADLSVSISNNDAGATVIYNRTEGSSIFIRTNKDGSSQDVITVSGTNVGINKTNPTEALDVVGKIKVTDGFNISSTVDATDLTTGSLQTAGGASITKSLQVGQTLSVHGTTNTKSILPTAINTYDIGSATFPYRNIFANSVSATTFSGSFTGQFIGSVTGTASKLASATSFSLTGDVTSNTISFNGQQTGGLATFTTQINQDFINAKTAINFTNSDDALILHRPTVGLRKITVGNFFSTAGVLPVGTIIPFAGPGPTPPPGFLFCDGSEVLVSSYPALYDLIQYTYKPVGLLLGVGTFALPDLRGRFALGADNMINGFIVPLQAGGTGTTTIDKNGNPSTVANRVTDVTADSIGSGNGLEDYSLAVADLPDHKHDLRGTTSSGTKGNQYYAIRNSADPISDIDAVPHTTNGPNSAGTGQFLTNSGGVDAPVLGNPVNLMNPYLTINYIIYTGQFT